MPAQGHPLRPAEPAPRTPERELLAAAVSRRLAAADQMAGIEDARSAVYTRTREAWKSVEAADEALAQAKAEEPRHLAAQALGEAVKGVNLSGATAARTAAAEALDLAQRTARALDEREAAGRVDLNAAVDAVRNAARAVVRAALAPLAREFDAARERWAIITAIAASLPGGCCPGRTDVLPGDWVGRDEARAWLGALAALESDADAALPGDTAKPAPSPAA